MDGPSVNLEFLESLCNLRESEGLPGLIDICVCQIYSMHGVFQTGTVKSTWNIHKILKVGWQIFHDNPARRDDCISLIISPIYHSLIISVLQDWLKVKLLLKEQSHYGSMWLKL